MFQLELYTYVVGAIYWQNTELWTGIILNKAMVKHWKNLVKYWTITLLRLYFACNVWWHWTYCLKGNVTLCENPNQDQESNLTYPDCRKYSIGYGNLFLIGCWKSLFSIKVTIIFELEPWKTVLKVKKDIIMVNLINLHCWVVSL